jgi:hypothetical protein
MSVNLTVLGQTWAYPETGDIDWGNQATGLIKSVVASLPPKLGGTFLITGEIDFGSVAGLKAKWFSSNSSVSLPGSGFLRMANADRLTWLSTNGTDSYSISVDADNWPKLYLNNSSFRLATLDLAQSFTKGQALRPFNVSSASGVLAFDLSQSNNFTCTLTENVSSITLANALDGQPITIVFKQGAGAYTVAWPTAFTFVGMSTNAPPVTTTSTKVSALTAVYYQTLGIWVCTLASQS